MQRVFHSVMEAASCLKAANRLQIPSVESFSLSYLQAVPWKPDEEETLLRNDLVLSSLLESEISIRNQPVERSEICGCLCWKWF